MELNKKTMQRIMLLIAFAVLLFWGLYNISAVTKVLGKLLDLLSPLLLGICIAFVLNLMMAALERLWDRALAKWSSPWRGKLKRPVCLTLTMVLFVGIIFAIFFILIPRLEEAGTTMVANIPTYVSQIQDWWENLSGFAAEHRDVGGFAGVGDAGQHFLIEGAAQLADADVVHEVDRFGALHGDVVNAVVHDVVADGVVLFHHHRDHQLGADSVDAGDHHRLLVSGEVDLEKPAETADRSQHFGTPGLRELPLDLGEQLGCQIDIHSGGLVQIALYFYAHFIPLKRWVH